MRKSIILGLFAADPLKFPIIYPDLHLNYKVATHSLNAPSTIQTQSPSPGHTIIDNDCAASTHIMQSSDIGE